MPTSEETEAMGERRTCHFCALPIPADEAAVRSKTGDAWAHFECWYDGTVFERDASTGRRLIRA